MHPARSASIATRNQAQRSHTCQGTMLFIGKRQDLDRETFPEASKCELLPEETGFCSA